MVYEILKRLISDLFAIDEQKIRKSMSFYDDLMADSLDIVELIMALEEEFDLEIPDSEAEKITTVGDAVEYIKNNV